MRAEQREFIDGLMQRVSALDSPGSSVPAPPRREQQEARAAFLREFVRIVGGLPEQAIADDVEPFRQHVMQPWEDLVSRITGAAARQLAQLDPVQHRMLRVLEDAPDLLSPLGLVRDELTHGRLLLWALTRSDEVGVTCRRAWLDHFGHHAVSEHGWRVRREVVLGPHCRVDLVVEVPGSLLQYIELKVDAEERPDQLPDYRHYLDKPPNIEGCARSLIFMTIKGYRSESGADHSPMSFSDLVRIWLPAASLHTANGAYLGAWLASVSRELLEISESGPFSTWSLSTQIQTLRALQSSTTRETS